MIIVGWEGRIGISDFVFEMRKSVESGGFVFRFIGVVFLGYGIINSD